MRLRFYLALGLALAVMTTGGGSPAHALVKPPQIDGERLLGGVVKQGKGVVKFGKVAPGPVGAILTAGSLAWWAYSEYDQKVHAPQPGGDAADWLGGGANYPTFMDDGVIVGNVISITSGRTVTMEIGCTAWSTPSPSTGITTCIGHGVSGGNVAISASRSTDTAVECRHNTTNVVRTVSPMVAAGSWFRSSSRHYTSPPTATVSQAITSCTTSETVIGFKIGATTTTPNPDGANRYQTGRIGYGTLQGSTLPEGELTFDTAVIDVTCRNAATDATQHIQVTSVWGAGQTLDMPSCKQRLGEDWYGIGVKVIPMDPKIDGVPLDPEVWPDWDVPDFIPEEWQPEPPTPEEEADPCHGTKTGCGLAISIDGEPVHPGTTTRTKIETAIAQDPERVTCKWGSREVEWKWCIPLLPSFEPGAGTSTTIDPTKPETTPGNPPTTGTGTQPVPTEASSCIKGAFSWNPVDWVFVPVKCALQWAFKPTTAFSTRIARVKTAFENKPPFSWLLTLDDLPAVSGAGCPSNLVFTFQGEDYPILCGTAMGDALHAFRPTMVVLLVGAAVYPFLRSLVYAAFPIIKPVPND